MMYILGIHSGFESGAALLKDGKPLYCINEERLTRIKGYVGLPEKSILNVLSLANIKIEDLSGIAQTGITQPSTHLDYRHVTVGHRLAGYLSCLPGINHLDKLFWVYRQLAKTIRKDIAVDSILNINPNDRRKQFFDHHFCHATTAYYCSPFAHQKEHVLVVTADGSGDGLSSTISIIKDDKIVTTHKTNTFNSIAAIYGYVTHNLGFKQHLHEGKITGLAAYGDWQKTFTVFQSVMSFNSQTGKIATQLGAFGPVAAKRLHMKLQAFKREDIAAGLQKVTELVIRDYIQYYLRRYKKTHLCLAGGLFANVRINQVLQELPEVASIYVQPAMGDAGIALGAALAMHSKAVPNFEPQYLRNAYLGPSYDDSEIETALAHSDLHYYRSDNIAHDIASLLAKEKVVVRFHGRMEYGPRALGHRSILYHTADPSINQSLNKRLNRTEFMPFAPILLKERAEIYFENFDPNNAYAASFMTITYQLTPYAIEDSPAIAHLDGTARPQFVTQEDNPDMHAILTSYEIQTGRPILINTSFNMHGEPIVCSPEDAIRAFIDGKLDVIAMGNFIAVAKSNKAFIHQSETASIDPVST